MRSRMPRPGSSAWSADRGTPADLVDGAGGRGPAGDARGRPDRRSDLVAEVGDFSRFTKPRQLMAYLGLAPSERSSGTRVRRGGITKAGNAQARRVLIEGAWTYRMQARVGRKLLDRIERLPQAIRDLAWRAQLRL